MRVASWSEVEAEFIARAHKAVWCNVATIDSRNRVRSRILHSIWDGPTGWIATRRNSAKARDLAHSAYVSLAYIADVVYPAYAECIAAWEDSPQDKQRIWDLFKNAPAPLGYDPAPIFGSPESADFGLLRLTPWRVVLGDATGPGKNVSWQS